MLDQLIIALIGFTSQFVDGSLGMGFGATSSSLLILMGMSPIAVSASIHIAKMVVGGISGTSHHAMGNVEKQLTLKLAAMGIIGGMIGAYLLVKALETDFIVPAIAVILLFMGIRIMLRFSMQKKEPHPGPPWGRFSEKHILPLGFVGGFVDAIGGAGWGPICMASLAGRTEREVRVIVGSVNMAEFIVSIAIVGTFFLALATSGSLGGMVMLAMPLILGGSIAAPMAAWTITKVSPMRLGVAVGCFLILINTYTISRIPVPGVDAPVWLLIVVMMVVACVAALVKWERMRQDRLRRARRKATPDRGPPTHDPVHAPGSGPSAGGRRGTSRCSCGGGPDEDLSGEEIRRTVREAYSRLARSGEGCCDPEEVIDRV
ncbi:MAG: sulfite exporter TauE/SafE family protein, partial [Thermoplasmata archaeon]|nr:sulfite exporter TauE/SafE family protein [Thermoplasmata archaeon]